MPESASTERHTEWEICGQTDYLIDLCTEYSRCRLLLTHCPICDQRLIDDLVKPVSQQPVIDHIGEHELADIGLEAQK